MNDDVNDDGLNAARGILLCLAASVALFWAPLLVWWLA